MKTNPSHSSLYLKGRSASRSVRGFTLIEMLVVIAIIALLASLLIGGLLKAKTRAAHIKGSSNMRQIGLMFQIYASDNDGYLPYAGVGNSKGWDAILVEAGTAKKDDFRGIFHDPAHKSNREFPRSYAMTRTNYRYGTGMDDWNARFYTNGKPVSLWDLMNPSGTLLLSEKFVPSNTYGSYSNCLIDYPQQAMDFTPDRKRCNYLFADGHVESVRPEAIIGGGTMTKPEGAWTRDPDD